MPLTLQDRDVEAFHMYRRMAALFWLGVLVAASPAMADPPDWKGSGKAKQRHEKSRHIDERPDVREPRIEHRRHFSERHRLIVREYYDDQTRRGKCPPGLAKKHNGCMPPGHAKKIRIGQRLPRDVIYHEVPAAVKVQLPPAGPGQEYVRVATDILLIAIGTAVVVDAIRDLGRM